MSDTIYLCNCGCDSISVSDWSDLYSDRSEVTVGISMWRIVGNYRQSWQRRLSLIWHIVKHEHPWTDSVLLNQVEARGVAQAILAIVDKSNGEAG